MPSQVATTNASPNLPSFLKSLRSHSGNTAVEQLIAYDLLSSLTTPKLIFCSLLRRRQVRGSRPCAIATTHLFLKVVSESKFKASEELLERVRNLGRRLANAQPRELAVGNIVRRVLGLIREVIEPTAAGDTNSGLPTPMPMTSLLPSMESRFFGGAATEDAPVAGPVSMRDVREDVLNGLREMLDEIDQADEQIASYSLEHIHPQEIIMTYTSSLTIQKFLLAATKRRKFTVIHIEGYPNFHADTYDTMINGRPKTDEEHLESNDRLKALTAAGVTVVVVPDSAVFALMSRVNKVILPAHAVLSDGSFVAQSGSRLIAQAAKAHRVPVIALGAVFKLSPQHPFDKEALVELGDSGKVLDYREGELVDNVDVVNPVLDFIPPNLTALFISNM